MKRPSMLWRLLALGAVAIVGIGTAGVLSSTRLSQGARADYHSQRARLAADLAAARQQGFTSQDLEPVTSQLSGLDSPKPPLWILEGDRYYHGQAARADRLDADLRALEADVMREAKQAAAVQVQGVQAGLAHDRQLGVAEPALKPLQQRYETVSQEQGAARTLPQIRGVAARAQALQKDVVSAGASLEAEMAALRQLAQQLLAQTAGDAGALRRLGRGSLAAGRDDASVAAYLNRPAPFKTMAQVQMQDDRLERYAPLLGSADVNQLALGAAAMKRYAEAIHAAVFAGLPPKVIVVSHQEQHLWAYQDGLTVVDTPVTTGRPQLPTDFGPMKVLRKSHPWKMHSPWPKGSPWWYPDAVVQYVLWFTSTGEGLHDAYWQPCCYGPGSEYNQSLASHGCIHVPYQSEVQLFSWTEVGTPVVVFPGDGSPVQSQLAQSTTDDGGNPLGAPAASRRGA